MKTVQILIFLLCSLTWGCAPRPEVPTIGAAASLRAVLPILAQSYEGSTGASAPLITYGASGKIVGQVVAGAPLDGVILASSHEMQRLAVEGLIPQTGAVILATNRLVLAQRTGQPPRSLGDVVREAASRSLAIGDPRFVPVGRYAREILEGRGLWETCEPHVIRGGHAAAVLTYLESGAVDAAIVYATDVHEHRGVSGTPIPMSGPYPRVVGTPIPGRTGDNDVDRFLRFMGSPEGQEILRSHGFGPPV